MGDTLLIFCNQGSLYGYFNVLNKLTFALCIILELFIIIYYFYFFNYIMLSMCCIFLFCRLYYNFLVIVSYLFKIFSTVGCFWRNLEISIFISFILHDALVLQFQNENLCCFCTRRMHLHKSGSRSISWKLLISARSWAN